MNQRILPAVLLLAVGCAIPSAAKTFVHPDFARRRPATVALEVQGPADSAAAVTEAVYEGLIAGNYSVQVPGESLPPGVGFVRVVYEAKGARLTGVLSMFDPKKQPRWETLFRAEGSGTDAEELAASLLRQLPAKQ